MEYDGLILNEGADAVVNSSGTEVSYRGISYVALTSNQFKNIDNTAPTTNDDVRYSAKEGLEEYDDYDKPITQTDVETLRGIGRKSVNEFTGEDIKKAQKWAYKFYQQMGTKSPFFRAWFGDWRAHDIAKINRIVVDTIDLGNVELTEGD